MNNIMTLQYGMIVSNVHASHEDKSNYTKDSFHVGLECVSGQFFKYHMYTLLVNFNAKVGSTNNWERKPT
jgi:hypothetical protein